MANEAFGQDSEHPHLAYGGKYGYLSISPILHHYGLLIIKTIMGDDNDDDGRHKVLSLLAEKKPSEDVA